MVRGIWTTLWRENKDLRYSQIHTKFQNWYGHAFHRKFGRYLYAHRADPLGTMAPMVVFAFDFKVATTFYGTLRDLSAANEASAAYSTGGYKTNPVPK